VKTTKYSVFNHKSMIVLLYYERILIIFLPVRCMNRIAHHKNNTLHSNIKSFVASVKLKYIEKQKYILLHSKSMLVLLLKEPYYFVSLY